MLVLTRRTGEWISITDGTTIEIISPTAESRYLTKVLDQVMDVNRFRWKQLR